MPPLFLPEIETLAESDPLQYEIFFRIQQAIAGIPISSGGAAPTPTPAVDPATGLPLTDASGNPLLTPANASNPPVGATTGSTATAVPGNEAALYTQTGSTGQASSVYVFGGFWQPIFKIVKPSDLSGVGNPGNIYLKPGMVIGQGSHVDNQGRPASSFFSNVVDNMSVILSQPVTQHGVTTQIDIASFTIQCGGFQVSYNSGSVDPGSFGDYTVFFDDPQYRGGAVQFQASLVSNIGASVAKRGRYYLGEITTAGGGGGSGSGGGSGGAGCFHPYTLVFTKSGVIPICYVRPGMQVFTPRGWRRVAKLLEHDYYGDMIRMPVSGLSTPGHRLWVGANDWLPAEYLLSGSREHYKGEVFNLSVIGDVGDDPVVGTTFSYTLFNGFVAHNLKRY